MPNFVSEHFPREKRRAYQPRRHRFYKLMNLRIERLEINFGSGILGEFGDIADGLGGVNKLLPITLPSRTLFTG